MSLHTAIHMGATLPSPVYRRPPAALSQVSHLHDEHKVDVAVTNLLHTPLPLTASGPDMFGQLGAG